MSSGQDSQSARTSQAEAAAIERDLAIAGFLTALTPLLTALAPAALTLFSRPPADVPPGPAPAATVNARMLDVLQRSPESRDWPASQWARHLQCSEASICKASIWRKIMGFRAEDAATYEIETDSRVDRRRMPRRPS